MVVSFIAAGILAGPSVLNLVHSHDSIELLAELGIAVLLFLVGLKLIRTLGAVALATGLGQVTFTSLIGFGIGMGRYGSAILALLQLKWRRFTAMHRIMSFWLRCHWVGSGG